MPGNQLEELVHLIIGYAVPLVEICGAVVVVAGVVRSALIWIRAHFRLDNRCMSNMRTGLVQSLVTGLEFQLASDVLKTAIAPTWEQILILGALVGLRTVMSFVLERELETLCGGNSRTTGGHQGATSD